MNGYLRHLAAFAKIVEAGSMRAAADLLGQSPSGLSDSVRILENKSGTPLLVRHVGGVTPTSEGERLYHYASEIVDLLDQALGTDNAEQVSGPCRLSVPTELAHSGLGILLESLGKDYPDLVLSVFAEDEIVDASRVARDYYIRITPEQEVYPGLRPLWAGEVNAILVVNAPLLGDLDPESADDLAHLTGIFATGRRPPYRFSSGENQTFELERAMFASHPAVRLQMAIDGLGIAGVLDICASNAIQDGILKRVFCDSFNVPLTLQLLTPHKRPRPLDEPLISGLMKLCPALSK